MPTQAYYFIQNSNIYYLTLFLILPFIFSAAFNIQVAILKSSSFPSRGPSSILRHNVPQDLFRDPSGTCQWCTYVNIFRFKYFDRFVNFKVLFIGFFIFFVYFSTIFFFFFLHHQFALNKCIFLYYFLLFNLSGI